MKGKDQRAGAWNKTRKKFRARKLVPSLRLIRESRAQAVSSVIGSLRRLRTKGASLRSRVTPRLRGTREEYQRFLIFSQSPKGLRKVPERKRPQGTECGNSGGNKYGTPQPKSINIAAKGAAGERYISLMPFDAIEVRLAPLLSHCFIIS